MKSLALALIAILSCCSLALAQDQTPADDSANSDIFNVYYSTQGYTVTIESKSGAVSVLEVPQGVLLNVEGHLGQNPTLTELPADEMPRIFRGDLVIRTRRADEVTEDEGHLSSSIMAKAPVAMQVKDGLVVVEHIVELEEESEGRR